MFDNNLPNKGYSKESSKASFAKSPIKRYNYNNITIDLFSPIKSKNKNNNLKQTGSKTVTKNAKQVNDKKNYTRNSGCCFSPEYRNDFIKYKLNHKDDVYIRKRDSIVKNIGAISIQGTKTKINQDNIFKIIRINNIENFNIFCLCDGHGINGELVSKFLEKYFIKYFNNLPQIKDKKDLEEIYQEFNKNDYKIIKQSFINAEEELKRKNTEIDITYSGSTCCMLIQIGKKLITANVGDSRAILVNNDDILKLSNDSKPNLKEEKKRITKQGGEVKQGEINNIKVGPYRVYKKGLSYPGLAMSRSIGDSCAHKLGVISEPTIIEKEIGLETYYALIASDGIWDTLDDIQINNTVRQFYEKNEPKQACNKLYEFSKEVWKIDYDYIDDISVIIIFF